MSKPKYAKIMAKKLRDAGFAVFYDNFYPEQLWGKNLTAFLDEVYRKKARFCVILVSKDYKEREWTNHELRPGKSIAGKGERLHFANPGRRN